MSIHRKFYYAYGIKLKTGGSDLVGQCPFCDKDDHFFVEPKEGLYCCHHCGEEGNHYTFLRKLLEQCDMPPAMTDHLHETRGILPSTFQHAEIRANHLSDHLLLPSRNERGRIINLLRVYEEENGDGEPKYVIRNSPFPLNSQIYRRETIPNAKTVIICEGQWDALAMVETLAHLDSRKGVIVPKAVPNYTGNMLKDIAVVSVPGARVFKDPWVKLFSGKNIVIALDNDVAGRDGTQKILKKFAASQVEIGNVHMMEWQDTDPNDLRDVFLEYEYYAVYQFVQDRLVSIDMGDVDGETGTLDVVPVTCSSWTELQTYYDSELMMTDDIRATLACMLAVVLSTEAGGGQLGLRVIGTPGSAKSTLAEAMSYCDRFVFPRSKLTGLVSGWGKVDKEHQVASKINGKCVIVKDADTMLQLPNLPQIESEIRDALGDGVIRAEYKTGKSYVINTVFTMILCGTTALRQMDDSLLGSRFLDVVIHRSKTPTDAIVRFAINSQFSVLGASLSGEEEEIEEGTEIDITKKKGIDALAPPTVGFIEDKKATLGVLEFDPPDEKILDQIHSMADYITYCRTQVKREKSDHIAFRPERELSTRVSEQLSRLAFFLALVFLPENRKKLVITQKVIGVLRKVCRDTSHGFIHEILQALASSKTPLSKSQISRRIKLGQSQTYYVLRDMRELGIVNSQKSTNIHGKGRPADYFTLTPKMQRIYDGAFK